MTTFLQAASIGLLNGGVLAIASVGLALIFSVMQVVNFAQGEFVMLGIYGVVMIYSATTAVSPLILALAMLPVFAIFGWGIHFLLIRRVTGVNYAGESGHNLQLMLTLGLSLFLTNVALWAFGAAPEGLPLHMQEAGWNVGGIFVGRNRLISLVLSFVLVVAIIVILRASSIGRQIRATVDDPLAAVYSGIDVRRVHGLVFAAGIALAGFGGGILANFFSATPYIGSTFIILMFTAVVLGGVGSVAGAFVGSLIVGEAESLTTSYISGQFQIVAVFVVFLLVLYFLPTGLFGRAGRQA